MGAGLHEIKMIDVELCYFIITDLEFSYFVVSDCRHLWNHKTRIERKEKNQIIFF